MLKLLLLYLLCVHKSNATLLNIFGLLGGYKRPDVKRVNYELDAEIVFQSESFLDHCHNKGTYTMFREENISKVEPQICYWCVCIYRDFGKCYPRMSPRCHRMRYFYGDHVHSRADTYRNRLRYKRSLPEAENSTAEIPQVLYIREVAPTTNRTCTNEPVPYFEDCKAENTCNTCINCDCENNIWRCVSIKSCYEDTSEESQLEDVKRLDKVIYSLRGNDTLLNGTFEDINQYVLENIGYWYNFNEEFSTAPEDALKNATAA